MKKTVLIGINRRFLFPNSYLLVTLISLFENVDEISKNFSNKIKSAQILQLSTIRHLHDLVQYLVRIHTILHDLSDLVCVFQWGILIVNHVTILF